MQNQDFNQLTIFDNQLPSSTVQSADLSHAENAAPPSKSGDEIISESELIKFVWKHQERM